jgi:transcriptional regulator with PAS, ATPase and Fis domain
LRSGTIQKIATRQAFDFKAEIKGLSPSQEECLQGKVSLQECVDNFTDMVVSYVLAKSKNNKQAADRLGIGRTTLVEYLARKKGKRPKNKVPI